MRKLIGRVMAVLAFSYCFQIAMFASAQNVGTTIRVDVDPSDHFVYYRIGENPRIRMGDAKLHSQLMGLAEKPRVIFLISNTAPISELDAVLMITDKYELNSVRFFICTYRTGKMTEVKRNDEGFFTPIGHTVPISDNP